MRVQGETAIVTGGGSGLGAATVRRLANGGARVAVLDLDEERGLQVAEDVGGVFVACDVASSDSLAAAVEQVIDVAGRPRIAVACAGISAGSRLIGRNRPHDLDLFDRVVGVNLTGTFNLFRLVAWEMRALQPLSPDGERGVLIATSSVAAFDGVDGGVAYSASKAGVSGMVLPLARDLAEFGIRSVAIAPGSFQTPMTDAMPPQYVSQMEADTPFPPRFGEPGEFAELIVHIATNAMLNGTTLRLDGGLRMRPSRLR